MWHCLGVYIWCCISNSSESIIACSCSSVKHWKFSYFEICNNNIICVYASCCRSQNLFLLSVMLGHLINNPLSPPHPLPLPSSSQAPLYAQQFYIQGSSRAAWVWSRLTACIMISSRFTPITHNHLCSLRLDSIQMCMHFTMWMHSHSIYLLVDISSFHIFLWWIMLQ